MMKKLLLTITLISINFIFGQSPITITSSCGNADAQGVYNYTGMYNGKPKYDKGNDCSPITDQTVCDNNYHYSIYWASNRWNWSSEGGYCIWLIGECVPNAQSTSNTTLAINNADTPLPPCSNWTVLETGYCEPVFSECTTLGTIDYTFMSNILLYPNPTTGEVNIELNKQNETVHIYLYNIYGQQLLQKDFKNTSSIKLNIQQPSGIYYVKLVGNSNEEAWIKLIKK